MYGDVYGHLHGYLYRHVCRHVCRDWQKLVHRHEFIHWQVLGQLPSAAENADEPIIESTSCVLGDGFHGMDRPKPPVKHTFKKPYFCAFRDAWYVWDRDKMEHVVGILKEKHGKTDDDIDAMRAFESEYFAERVP